MEAKNQKSFRFDNILIKQNFKPMYYLAIVARMKREFLLTKTRLSEFIVTVHTDPVVAYQDYNKLIKEELSQLQKTTFDYVLVDSFGRDILDFCKRLYDTPEEAWLSLSEDEPEASVSSPNIS
jgi:hypothetical protein